MPRQFEDDEDGEQAMPSHGDALALALASLTLLPQDGAAVRLAHRYAELLDTADPDVAIRIGPAFLAVLESLAMTPRARALLAGKGGTASDGRSGMDELRRKRAARRDSAAAVDATSP